MRLDPWNHPLKIQESIGTLTLKVRAYLRVCEFIPSHSFTFLGAWIVTFEFHFWIAFLQALALVVSLWLRLQYCASLNIFCFIMSFILVFFSLCFIFILKKKLCVFLHIFIIYIYIYILMFVCYFFYQQKIWKFYLVM
jgi:hypothetical protein